MYFRKYTYSNTRIRLWSPRSRWASSNRRNIKIYKICFGIL